MEAAPAIGLATGIIRLTEFALKSLGGDFDNFLPKGASQDRDRLVMWATNLMSITFDLQLTLNGALSVSEDVLAEQEAQLRRIALNMSKTSYELSNELRQVSQAGNFMSKIWKAVRQGKTIEKLKAQAKEAQDFPNTRVLATLCQHAKKLTEEDSDILKAQDDHFKHVTNRLVAGFTTIEDVSNGK